MIFKNRVSAGKQLAEMLLPLASKDLIVLGLPRGGVPVAYEVAKRLNKPLDVIIVRKLGVPWQPELAFGAVSENDIVYLNESVITDLGISKEDQAQVLAEEKEEVAKRQHRFRGNRAPLDITNRSVVIVDDGIATGATAQAACQVATKQGAKEVLIATPVATKESLRKLSAITSQSFVIDTPDDFFAVGQWYEDFLTVTDEEVQSILEKYRGEYGS